MNDMTFLLAGYLVGSVPFAYLLARRRGVDLRAAGSGNLGASNVFRTTGKMIGFVVAVLDVLKGVAVIMVVDHLGAAAPLRTATGVAAVVGHVLPVWLRFRGGKGVATTCGVFSVLAPTATAWLAAVFALTLWTSRYVSIASMVAATLLGPVAFVTGAPGHVAAADCLLGALVVYRHRSNVARLLDGTERRLGQRA